MTTQQEITDQLPTGFRLVRLTPRRANHWRDGWYIEGPNGSKTPVCDTPADLARHLPYLQAADVALASKRAENAAAAIVADAEQVVAEAARGTLATDRQVAYILSLLARRDRDGEGGGFFSGPTDEAGIRLLPRDTASAYITSLTGRY